ncbi:CidA/LrgA family protein [Klebsiella sp. BIGb0407]|uniref:CidA/LrgA family protein n=1 Tax=Klebsiella sp. BIGb0407 TaxID=2940603 RepID=UPI00216A0A64|nr:CidA/LrgA family protein [Klebsiella sp. BIGb0407]MCS3430291.1 holin-like protein [Klebsiella sp. BIGb0407]
MNAIKTASQLMVYIGLFLIAQFLVLHLTLPLPANIVGMMMMLVFLVSGILPVRFVKAGSAWLLSEMLLFFVPAVVAIINYFNVLEKFGIRIFAVIILSTILVLGCTAFVVDKLFIYENRKAHD